MSDFKGLTNSDLDLLGFKAFSHFTVGDQSKYQLSRKRHLSAMCVGTCNESFWLCQKDETGEISDLICVHNYDQDGFITNEKIKALIEWFDGAVVAVRDDQQAIIDDLKAQLNNMEACYIGIKKINDEQSAIIQGHFAARQDMQKRIDEYKKLTVSIRNEFDLWSDDSEFADVIEAQIENLEALRGAND